MGFSSGRYFFNESAANIGVSGQYSKLAFNAGRKETGDGVKEKGKGQTEDKPVKINRLITVEPVIIMYYLTHYASQPVMQQYLYKRLIAAEMSNDSFFNNTTAIDLFQSSSNHCGISGDADSEIQQAAQAKSAMYSIAFGLATVVPALFTTVLFGSYSDRAGRKWAIIPPAIGDIVIAATYLFVMIFELPLPLLVVGTFIDGLLGGAPLILGASFAYIADVTTKERRAFRIILIDILLGMGNMTANIAIGYIIKGVGYTYSLVIVFAIHIINMTYIIFFLPETRKKQKGATLLDFEHYKKPIQLYTKKHTTPRRLILLLALLIFVLYMISDQANSGPLNLYIMKEPLCWGSVIIGYYQAAKTLVRYVMSFVLLKFLLKPLSESGLLIMGGISCVLYDLVLSQARQTWVVYVSTLAGFGMELVTAMVRAIASKSVSQDEQGALFSGLSWMSLLSGLTGAIVFNMIYAKTVYIDPLFVFYVASLTFSLLTLLACILHFILRKRRKRLNFDGSTKDTSTESASLSEEPTSGKNEIVIANTEQHPTWERF